MLSLPNIWEQLLTMIKQEAGSRVVDTWLRSLLFHKWDSVNGVAYLKAPNTFVRDWVTRNYIPLLQTCLSRLLTYNNITIMIFESSGDGQAQESPLIIPSTSVSKSLVTTPTPSLVLPARLLKARGAINKNYQFDTFVKGPNNQMAFAAAQAVVQKPGSLYNPLFIYGGSGLGKTHLLHAIANQLMTHFNTLEVLYQSAERFVGEFIHAIRFDKVQRFQSKYKNVDVLLIDDIQCISNKEQTQEAFFIFLIRSMNHINRLFFQVIRIQATCMVWLNVCVLA